MQICERLAAGTGTAFLTTSIQIRSALFGPPRPNRSITHLERLMAPVNMKQENAAMTQIIDGANAASILIAGAVD